jgi:hypothetical protein
MSRALTVKAPWAWAIVHAGKNIENRSWTTKYRGRIYIHAGMSDCPEDRDEVESIIGREVPVQIARGALVAAATLVDIVPLSEANASPWASGPFCWVLDDVKALYRPKPMPGRLSLWVVPR